MRISALCCLAGTLFVLAIAILHGSGFGSFTAEFEASNASAFLKAMFPILYIMPSLYLLVLGAFGILAAARPAMRRAICLLLAPATLAAGGLALLIGEWVPLIVMGLGAGLFLAASVTAART